MGEEGGGLFHSHAVLNTKTQLVCRPDTNSTFPPGKALPHQSDNHFSVVWIVLVNSEGVLILCQADSRMELKPGQKPDLQLRQCEAR